MVMCTIEFPRMLLSDLLQGTWSVVGYESALSGSSNGATEPPEPSGWDDVDQPLPPEEAERHPELGARVPTSSWSPGHRVALWCLACDRSMLCTEVLSFENEARRAEFLSGLHCALSEAASVDWSARASEVSGIPQTDSMSLWDGLRHTSPPDATPLSDCVNVFVDAHGHVSHIGATCMVCTAGWLRVLPGGAIG